MGRGHDIRGNGCKGEMVRLVHREWVAEEEHLDMVDQGERQ